MTYQQLPSKTYDLIVVDPPWELKKIKSKMRPNQHGFDYPTLSLDQIQELNIPSISHDNSILFLWTTQKYLFDAKNILQNWRYTPLLTMVWEKTYGKSSGMPLYGFRWNAEFILVGYKTKLPLYPKRKLIPAVFQAPNIKHSQKPDLFYELISPLGQTKIDLFARQQRPGWDVWGNEV